MNNWSIARYEEYVTKCMFHEMIPCDGFTIIDLYFILPPLSYCIDFTYNNENE